MRSLFIPLLILLMTANLFLLGCGTDVTGQNNSDSIQRTTDSVKEHLLLIGDDTFRFKPIFDSQVCDMELKYDPRWSSSDTGLISFETEKRDTIWIDNYRDYYDPCTCYVLDTTPQENPKRFIPASKYMGPVFPAELIAYFENGVSFKSPLGAYSVESFLFCAYCPSGKCQYSWHMHSESPFNADLKNSITEYFNQGIYLVLQRIIIKDRLGKQIRIHPGLCWLGR